jgi:NAD-dependent deacetylase
LRIVILTGAGISAESGLSTFRDRGGIWARFDWRDVATPEGFARDPAAVMAFYNMRRQAVLAATPNAAHEALARLETSRRHEVLVVTQNVDDLHEQAGTRALIHMHGAHKGALCAACGHRWPAPDEMRVDDPCPACTAPATRPDVVWFGETPYRMADIHAAVARADLFVSVGTSGTVQPAAGLVRRAKVAGARTLELNLEPSSRAALFDEARHGKATVVVPDWVEDMLAG